MYLPQVREGEIGPFESIKLEVVFTPTIPGEARLDFHIKFSNLSSKPVRHNMFIIFWMVLKVYRVINIGWFCSHSNRYLSRWWVLQSASLCGWLSQALIWRSACLTASIKTVSWCRAGRFQSLRRLTAVSLIENEMFSSVCTVSLKHVFMRVAQLPVKTQSVLLQERDLRVSVNPHNNTMCDWLRPERQH